MQQSITKLLKDRYNTVTKDRYYSSLPLRNGIEKHRRNTVTTPLKRHYKGTLQDRYNTVKTPLQKSVTLKHPYKTVRTVRYNIVTTLTKQRANSPLRRNNNSVTAVRYNTITTTLEQSVVTPLKHR